MKNGLTKTNCLLALGGLFIGVFFALSSLNAKPAVAAAGINQTINFQGRLLNSQGAVVPDGFYNLEFKIYQDGDGQSAGNSTGSPSGSLKWTEDWLNQAGHGVKVVNGYMSVQLGTVTPFGTSVDWNQDTLWLSMNVAGTNLTCTPFSSCTPDGEMLPMQPLTAAPYALNAGRLGGLASTNFIQLAQGVQTDNSTASSLGINKTGASGDILQLQKNGVDVVSVDNSGSLLLGQAGTGGQNGKLVFNTTNSSATAITLQAASTASSYTLTLPTSGPSTSQCLQTDVSDNTQLVFGPCGATGTFLSKNATDTSSADAGSGYLYSFTNSGSAGSGGVLSLDNGTNTGSVLSVKGNSATAFQVINNSTNQIFTVDTSSSTTILGKASTVNGALVFQNSTTSNGITLNSTNSTSAYTLTLPSTAPAGGLCIETSPGNASQLVFASCSNNNASIQEVATWDSNNTNTVSVSPSTAGNEMVLTTQIPTNGVTVTGVSGGGVTNWSQVVTNAGNGTVHRVEMWVGTVTTTGSSTITVTYSASPGSEEITATEFTAAGVNSNTSWGIESSAGLLNSTSSSTVTFPSLTAVSGFELYVGYAQVQNPPATAGSSTGFSYSITSTQHNAITYNPSLTSNTNYQPTANQNSSGQSNTVAAILTAFVTSSSINNTTSLQKANFYVQAASSGTVAGVLQAASSGTADILNLRNSGSTNVLTVGSTGDVLIKPAASATAFQVQNTSGYSILTVDSSSSKVVLGKSGSLGGSLVFADAGDSNTITLTAPSTVAASYSLSLPNNTPTAGLCLGTSPSNANQLIFASCATQVSAASISYVNKWSNSGTSVTTISDSPASVGNLLTLFSHTTNNVTISSVSGGGVTNWTKITGNTGITGGNVEMWRGAVTATGSATITVTYSGAAGTNDITAQEFSMGTTGGTWAIDTSGTTNGTSATINYPSLTPAASSELYAGYAWGANTMSAGSTSGYTYLATSLSKYLAYDTNVTGGTPQQPTATQNTSGNYNSVAALIQAYAGTSVIVNSQATQQANFNVQASLSGTVAGVLQAASSGSADIFQAKDSSGNNVMAVNATGGVILGTSSAVAGTLVFKATGNSNTVTIAAPTTPGSSYSLKLPAASAAPGQCLAASPSDATQLVFSSCANQVTSVQISHVNSWKTSGNGATTLSVSPANINDLMVFFSSPRGSASVTNVTGGGVSVWSKITSTTAGSGSDTSSIDMWRGVVTTTGSSTITVTFSGSTGNPNELAAMEFTTGSATGSWVVDASNTQYNSASSTTITFPNLTPQSSRDLYVGYAAGSNGNTASSGGTTGYTYVSGNISNRIGLYNPNVSAASQPTATQSSSGSSLTVGALIAAYSSSSVLSNSTVTQQANFNIQAATSTSVAGILQAYPGSSYDIFQIMNDTGTVTDSFSSTGNLLVKPSTVSASALQVQTAGGVNILAVDTSGKQVVVGAGSTGESSPSLLVLDNQTGSSADPSGVNGSMYYNATTHAFRCYSGGAWQNCGGLIYANTSKSSAVSNCTTNCVAFNTVAPIPANYCQAGRVIKLSAAGYFSSQAGASNLQFGVYYGTDNSTASNDTLIGSLSPAVSVSSASNNYFNMKFDIICFSTSSMQAEGTLGIQVGSAAAGLTVVPMNTTSGTTVVTTSAKNLYIFPIWDTASSSNTTTLTQFGVSSP